jgi:hypothetical protein
MSIGTMGVVRPADVSIGDIEMYYNYAPDRYTDNNEMFKLEATELLEYCYLPSDDENALGGEDLLEGLYNMKLPASTFNQLGIYTIYVKSKRVSTTIIDCSVLSSLPSVKGIVLDINSLPVGLTSNNALQGYRIEYLNDDGSKLRNVARYVVTSNKVSVSTENVGNTTQKTQRYRFDDVGSLLFIQLTPSSASDVKPNASPFIGNIGQTILLSNTFFTPVVLEVELVENTIDTLTNFVAGEQIKDVEKGILTYYDKDRVITKQFDLFEVKDDVTDVPLYEVKEQRESIDTTQDFDDVTDFDG